MPITVKTHTPDGVMHTTRFTEDTIIKVLHEIYGHPIHRDKYLRAKITTAIRHIHDKAQRTNPRYFAKEA